MRWFVLLGFVITAQVFGADASFLDQVDAWFGTYLTRPIGSVFFYRIGPFPLIILVLALGGIFFTFWYNFINVRGFRHCLAVIRGDYDRKDDQGEISSFQAVTSALSATVGLGNIASVAVAIGIGGPGAVFWMWMTALFGMSSKFSSCMFSQVYRDVDADGRVLGGPMYYIRHGLPKVSAKLGPLAKVLAGLFAVLCMGASLGGGNLFQANQTYVQLSGAVGLADADWFAVLTGITLSILVGLVLLGGAKRLGAVTGRIVPWMCGVYVVSCLFVLAVNIVDLPAAFVEIVHQAFAPRAAFGGFAAVLITGIQRAAFSNEAGVGSAAIVHAAAKTEEPVREGIVAMIEPFIDTILICTMTSLIIVVTGVYENRDLQGVAMTSAAFATVISWFPIVLTIAIAFFAYSTMISWAYYGEQAARYLFGAVSAPIFRLVFVIVTALGPLLQLNNVITFSDLMILGMAFPNIIAMVLLSGQGRRLLKDYWTRYREGQFNAKT